MASFKETFASNRKAGKSTFMWNDKSYNTKMKGGGAPKKSSLPKTGPKIADRPASGLPKTAPIPTPRPGGGITIGTGNKVVDGAKKVRENPGNAKYSAKVKKDLYKSETNKGGFVGAPKIKGKGFMGAMKDVANGFKKQKY